jgi:hypothetical protein
LFLPWRSVDRITIIDPEKWYYKTQSDPRVSLPEAFEYLAQLYDKKIDFVD